MAVFNLIFENVLNRIEDKVVNAIADAILDNLDSQGVSITHEGGQMEKTHFHGGAFGVDMIQAVRAGLEAGHKAKEAK